MVIPTPLTDPEDAALEELTSSIREQVLRTDRLQNLEDKLGHLEESLRRNGSALDRFSGAPALQEIEQDIQDRLFDLQNADRLIERIEERLGRGDSEPVDLTLQQTLDVVQQLQNMSATIPNDERLGAVATNICEGLESFVTSVLHEADLSEEEGEASETIGPGPGDLTLALEVIETIHTCPGADRTSLYKALRQQFIDGACRSAWSRVDRLFDMRLERSTRKEYLHEALTIWTLLPDLSENSGSPRLSQLPEDILRTIQETMLREVIGATTTGDRQALLNAAILTKELAEDYLPMIPAIPVLESQTALGLQASDTLLRRIKAELSSISSRRDLELCLSAISVLRSVPGLEEDRRFQRLSSNIRFSSWRVRAMELGGFLRGLLLPVSLSMVATGVLFGVYIGLGALAQRLYDVNIPLAP